MFLDSCIFCSIRYRAANRALHSGKQRYCEHSQCLAALLLHLTRKQGSFMACESCEARFKCVCNLESEQGKGLSAWPLPYMIDAPLKTIKFLNNKLSLVSNVGSLKGLLSDWSYSKLNGRHFRFSRQVEGHTIFIGEYEAREQPTLNQVNASYGIELESDSIEDEISEQEIQEAITSWEALLCSPRDDYYALKALDNPIYRDLEFTDHLRRELHLLETPNSAITSLRGECPGLFSSRDANNYYNKPVPITSFTRYILHRPNNSSVLTRFSPSFLPALFPMIWPHGEENWCQAVSRFVLERAELFGQTLENYLRDSGYNLDDIELSEPSDQDLEATFAPPDVELPEETPRKNRWSVAKYFEWLHNVALEALIGPLGQELISTLYDCWRETRISQYTKIMLNNLNRINSDMREIFIPYTLPGSSAYWRRKHDELEALCSTLGNCTFFLTLTANPKWPEFDSRGLTDNIFTIPC